MTCKRGLIAFPAMQWPQAADPPPIGVTITSRSGTTSSISNVGAQPLRESVVTLEWRRRQIRSDRPPRVEHVDQGWDVRHRLILPWLNGLVRLLLTDQRVRGKRHHRRAGRRVQRGADDLQGI